MLNRTIAPAFKTIDKIDIHRTHEHRLGNGIQLFTLSAGSQEITKIELIFRAGMYMQPATLVASATNNLLESGTRSFTANELSEGIDFYGSFLELQVEQDYATVTLYSLNKYLDESLRFVEEIIKYPVFPEKEFKIYITNKKQKHAINSQKVSILAKRKFTEVLFGEQHPYGRQVQESDFSRISVGDLHEFFKNNYTAGSCTIIASGCLPQNLTEVIEKHFGGSDWGRTQSPLSAFVAAEIPAAKHHYIHRPDAIQSAIRVGKLLFNKTHPDYYKFQVLNTVLGGYFGSRLMANIREDKGYTYGIGSGISNLVHAGYFFISTEVGADVTRQTLDEIYKEINKLRTGLVDERELESVRNYILGHFLRSVDGPFSLADKFRSIWEYGLDYSFFENYFHAVKTVKPNELRDLANKYLDTDTLLECVAGKME